MKKTYVEMEASPVQLIILKRHNYLLFPIRNNIYLNAYVALFKVPPTVTD
jgi:hypothetical protein